MAKKSSNNAVKKLDKQIKDLENSIKEGFFNPSL